MGDGASGQHIMFASSHLWAPPERIPLLFKALALKAPRGSCLPGKLAACNHGLISVGSELRSMDYGLLWGIVAHHFGLLG